LAKIFKGLPKSLKIQTQELEMSTKTTYDVIILGTGPAGLQAAIHAARK